MTEPYQAPAFIYTKPAKRAAAQGMLTPKTALAALCLTALLIVLIRNAWVGEDSYIDWRVTENIWRGHGPVWNVGERVQVYSNVLYFWLVTLFYGLTHEVFLTSTILSLTLTCWALWRAYKLADMRPALVVGLTAGLLAGKGFIDYAASGLENPLTYFLLIVFLGRYLRVVPGRLDHLFALVALTALLFLNRPDAVLLVAPALVHAAWQELAIARQRGKVWQLLLGCMLAAAPMWGWLLFSTWYYGVPLPNTFYYKVAPGLAKSEYIKQGVLYFVALLEREPQTVLGLVAAPMVALSVVRSRVGVALVGMALYMAYVIWVGADFMGGRFVSAPYFMGLALAGYALRDADKGARAGLALGGLLLLTSFIGIRPPVLSDQTCACKEAPFNKDTTLAPCFDEQLGHNDERAYWYAIGGLLPSLHRGGAYYRTNEFDHYVAMAVDRGARVVQHSTIGYAGYAAADRGYIHDLFGLADPLLPLMPFKGYGTLDRSWFPGHLARREPAGYLETLYDGQNRILNPYARRMYDDVYILTRAPLGTPGRWAAIWRRNTQKVNLDSLRYPATTCAMSIADTVDAPGFAGGKALRYQFAYALEPGTYTITIRDTSANNSQIWLSQPEDTARYPAMPTPYGPSATLPLHGPADMATIDVYTSKQLHSLLPDMTYIWIDKK